MILNEGEVISEFKMKPIIELNLKDPQSAWEFMQHLKFAFEINSEISEGLLGKAYTQEIEDFVYFNNELGEIRVILSARLMVINMVRRTSREVNLCSVRPLGSLKSCFASLYRKRLYFRKIPASLFKSGLYLSNLSIAGPSDEWKMLLLLVFS